MGMFTPQTTNNPDAIAKLLTGASIAGLVVAIGLLPILILP